MVIEEAKDGIGWHWEYKQQSVKDKRCGQNDFKGNKMNKEQVSNA